MTSKSHNFLGVQYMKDKRILLIILVIVLFLWYQNTQKSSVCVPVSYINHSKFEITGWKSDATAAAPTVAYKIDGSVPASPPSPPPYFYIYDLTGLDPNKLLSDLKKSEDTLFAAASRPGRAGGEVWAAGAATAAAEGWGSLKHSSMVYIDIWDAVTPPGSGQDVLIAGYYLKPDSDGNYTLNSAYTDYKFAKLP